MHPELARSAIAKLEAWHATTIGELVRYNSLRTAAISVQVFIIFLMLRKILKTAHS